MTYAPDDLKAVQRYVQTQTGQEWAALGIVGDTSHQSSGGYHVGGDVLRNLGRAPEQPGSDYSYAESSRDRGGLTDAASAFDLGGNFGRFREITLGIVAACQGDDPLAADIREVIYTPDGKTVRRFDRLGIRSSGDDSHLSHTHISFFRDSEGRRSRGDNFLGLLAELFEGAKGGDDMLKDDPDGVYLYNRMQAIANMNAQQFGPEKGTVPPIVQAIKQIQADMATLKAAVAKLAQPVVNVDAAALAGLPKPPTAAEVVDELGKRIGNG